MPIYTDSPYNKALDLMNVSVRDFAIENPATSIVVYCQARKIYVLGQLASPITLSAQASWSSIGQTLGSLLTMADTAASAFLGRTIQQAWMGRAIYSGTQPMSYTIKTKWVATHSAYQQVFLPAFALLSLVYPRKGADTNLGSLFGGGTMTEEDKKKWTEANNKKPEDQRQTGGAPTYKGNEALGKLGETLMAAHIPGPSLLYNLQSKFQTKDGKNIDQGDYVSLQVGRFIRITGGYISQVSVTTSNVMDQQGYPLSAEASFTYNSFDNMWATSTPPFFESGEGDLAATANAASKLMGFMSKYTGEENTLKEKASEEKAKPGDSVQQGTNTFS